MPWFYKLLLSIPLIIGVISPEFMWTISEGWKFKDAEPSETYLVMSRVMAVIVLIVLWFVIPH